MPFKCNLQRYNLVLFAQGMKDSHDLAHVELESKVGKYAYA